MSVERSPLPQIPARPGPGPVLYFAPHPDDDLIGGGGTLALHRAQGDAVRVVIAYDGAKGQMGEDPLPDEQYIELRETEARRGGAHLGLTDYRFLRYPEGHMPDPGAFAGAVAHLAKLIEETQPHTIYAPWIGEHQIDHHVLGLVVLEAIRETGFRGEAFGFDVWTPLVPTCVIDVSSTWKQVVAGLAEHRTQTEFTELGHHASGLAAHRALYLPKGARYGEGFCPLGTVPGTR